MVSIKKQFVSANVIDKRSYGHGNAKKYICIHETDNPNKGADAQAHANLQSRLNPREASWHYQVDDKQAIQSFPHSVRCWAGGDGRYGAGNNQSIHIEICVNSDGDFHKAVQNAAELTKKVMQEEGIPASRVVQHNKWRGKNCPRQLRSGTKGVNWSDFMSMVKDGECHAPKESPKTKVPKPAPAKPKKTTPSGRWSSIQSTLNTRYGLNIAVDNIPGPETRRAIVKGVQTELNRQFGKGLVVDGIVGPRTRSAFVNVHPGSRGNLTWLLQAALLFNGFDPGSIDGINGGKTQAALRAFQRAKGLAVDGIAGKQTWSKLLG